jgi:hypothetical protein
VINNNNNITTAAIDNSENISTSTPASLIYSKYANLNRAMA